MKRTSLGRKLRVLRGDRGWSMRAAAAEIGVTKETLSALERGTREPHDPTLAKIAKGYGVPFEELLEEEISTAGDLSEGAPQIGREAFVEHGIEPSDAEVATLNALLKVYTEMGNKKSATLEIPEGPVDMQRVHMLAEYARDSGILTPEDIATIRDGVRAKLVAGGS